TADAASGLPPNVDVCSNGSRLSGSYTAAVATTADTGTTPPPNALPASRMSGDTPSESTPHHDPSRPMPVEISSTTSNAPAASHASRTSARYPSAGSRTPPSDCTGSSSTAHSPGRPATASTTAAASPNGTRTTPGTSGSNGSRYRRRPERLSAPNVLPWNALSATTMVRRPFRRHSLIAASTTSAPELPNQTYRSP